MSVVVASSPDSSNDQPEVIDLAIKKIKLSGATQPRQAIDSLVVAEYAEEMLGGTEFPPITVYFDGKVYWCSDGFHRVAAAIKAGLDTIKTKVFQGDQRDALLASFSANAEHGLRRTNIDKRRSVTKMLEDLDWARLPDREIARLCRVSSTFVRSMRNQLGIDGSSVRVVGSGGPNPRIHVVRKPVLDDQDQDQDEATGTPLQPTKSTVFDAYLARVKGRGTAATTHVMTDFGPIDIETPDAIYIIAGSMTLQTFRNAFITLLFQRRKRKEKRAVIVGTTTADLNPWIREARKHGVEVHEFNG
jgi:uncharacterized ParB-like nuclease family protein